MHVIRTAILVVLLVILLLFGKGRFSDMMGDVAKGLKSFKKGMTEDEESAAAEQPPRRISDERVIDQPPAAATAEPVRPASEADRP